MAMLKLVSGRIMYAEPSTVVDHKIAQLKAAIDGVEFDETAWLQKIGGTSADLNKMRRKLVRLFRKDA